MIKFMHKYIISRKNYSFLLFEHCYFIYAVYIFVFDFVNGAKGVY